MSLATLCLIVFLVIAATITLLIALVLASTVRSARRIMRRARAYGDLPIIAQASRAPDDIARIEAAVAAIAALLARIQTACGRIIRPGVLGVALRRLPAPADSRLH